MKRRVLHSRHIYIISKLCIVLVGVVGGIANASDPNEGALDIQSFLNAQASENTARGARYSDFYNTIPSSPILSGMHNVTSFFSGQDNQYDQRPADNKEPFDIRLIYNGTITENKTSRLQFSFPYDPDYMFGDKEITFSSARLPYGSVVDIRKVIDQNGGVLSLVDAPAGTSGEYGTGILTIGTRLLADLSDNGEIDLLDFSLLAQDWQKPQGQYVGDITGEYGIPDGVVDIYDLVEFCSQWLE